MYWQNNGDYVCVRVDRYKRLNVVREDDRDNIKYSGLYHNFEMLLSVAQLSNGDCNV